MRYVWATAVGVLAVLSVFGDARQADTATQVFVSGANLVQVDVSVLDRNRRPVRDLKSTDFTVLEDGKPRPVASFAVVDLPMRADTTRAAWTRSVPADVVTNDVPREGRLVVLLMDRTIPFGGPTLMARSVARAAIDQLVPGDLAAVVHTGSGLPQDFTDDRARLLIAIGENPSAGLSRDAAERWEVQNDQLEASLWDPDPTRPQRILPGDNSGECYCGLCVLDSIRLIADAVQDTHGRKKSLLFIGADINIDTVAPACQGPVIDAREVMFKAIDRASLTVHAFDANGLESNVVASSSQGLGVSAPLSPRSTAQTLTAARSQQLLMRQGHLAVLPDRTGGRTILNSNNPEGRVPDVFRETASYYLLGFEPTATDGREHTIGVRVNRGGVNVLSRRTYVATPRNASTPAAPVDRLRNATAGVIAARNGVALTVSA